MAFSLCVFCTSYRDTGHIGFGPKRPHADLVSSASTILPCKSWVTATGVRASHMFSEHIVRAHRCFGAVSRMASDSRQEDQVLSFSKEVTQHNRGKGPEFPHHLASPCLMPDGIMAAKAWTYPGTGTGGATKGQRVAVRLASQITWKGGTQSSRRRMAGRARSCGSLGPCDSTWGLRANSHHCLGLPPPSFLQLVRSRGAGTYIRMLGAALTRGLVGSLISS